MRIPIISDWLDAKRARKEAEERSKEEKKKRAAIRKKATTEQRKRRSVTDTVFGEVVATTKEIESGILLPRRTANGRTLTPAELAEIALDAEEKKRNSQE